MRLLMGVLNCSRMHGSGSRAIAIMGLKLLGMPTETSPRYLAGMVTTDFIGNMDILWFKDPYLQGRESVLPDKLTPSMYMMRTVDTEPDQLELTLHTRVTSAEMMDFYVKIKIPSSNLKHVSGHNLPRKRL